MRTQRTSDLVRLGSRICQDRERPARSFNRKLWAGDPKPAPWTAEFSTRKAADSCYQTCYHFLEKTARNRKKHVPTRWIMSLKYKEQHETRRNINQTHNPKVEGSNPSPATKTPSKNSLLPNCSNCARFQASCARLYLLPTLARQRDCRTLDNRRRHDFPHDFPHVFGILILTGPVCLKGRRLACRPLRMRGPLGPKPNEQPEATHHFGEHTH